MNDHRVPAGTPSGGQYAAAERREPELTLRAPVEEPTVVEFARDEAEQVDQALARQAAAAGDPSAPSRRPREWSQTAMDALSANDEARRQVLALRDFLNGPEQSGDFATRAFTRPEFLAMTSALSLHREHVRRAAETGTTGAQAALVATDAALFRLDIAGPGEADR